MWSSIGFPTSRKKLAIVSLLLVSSLFRAFFSSSLDTSLSSSVVNKINKITEEQLIQTTASTPKEQGPLLHKVVEDALQSVAEKDRPEYTFGASPMDVRNARSTYLPETKLNWKSWARDAANNKFAYLHVGKAGGSSLYCILVNGADDFFCKGWSSSLDIPPLISVHFEERIHMGGTQHQTNHSVFLVSLRNPVERIISAFNYEQKIKWIQKSLPAFRRTCFPGEVQELFLKGLSPSPPTNNETDQEHYCWRLAHDVTKGNIPNYNSHFTYNYESYEKVFLPTGKHLLAIRTSQMNQDLVNLQRLLQTGMVPDVMVNVTKMDVVEVRNKDKRTVNNDGLSGEAYANACQVLCQEIQVYKRFLYRAENLDDQMVSESIRELQAVCPAERFEARSDCGEENLQLISH
jgi:hypothetical protein